MTKALVETTTTTPPQNRHQRRLQKHVERRRESDDDYEPAPRSGDHFLSKRDLEKKVCLTFPYVWRLIRDDKFPKGRAIGSRTVWLNSEVEAWMRERPVREYKPMLREAMPQRTPLNDSKQTKNRGASRILGGREPVAHVDADGRALA